MFIVITFYTIQRVNPISVIINNKITSLSILDDTILQFTYIHDKYINIDFQSNKECLKAHKFVLDQIEGYLTSTVCQFREEIINNPFL